MDPEQMLLDVAAYIIARNLSGAVESLAGYYRWRLKGGGEPLGVRAANPRAWHVPLTSNDRGDEIADALVTRLCAALERYDS